MRELLITLQTAALLLTALAAGHATSQTSPAGNWHSIDDESGRPRAEISITELNGVLTGRIVRSLLAPTSNGIQLCDKCTDDRQGKPLIGMEIVRKLTRSSETDTWGNGQILDPDKGKTYPLQIKLIEGGKKLQVRGFVGPFFRTQIWHRVSGPIGHSFQAVKLAGLEAWQSG